MPQVANDTKNTPRPVCQGPNTNVWRYARYNCLAMINNYCDEIEGRKPSFSLNVTQPASRRRLQFSYGSIVEDHHVELGRIFTAVVGIVHYTASL